MERPRRRRSEPAALDITWLSCRGVKSSLPFHTPCLYASIFAVWSSSSKDAHRRQHRMKTPADRAGGENPEWDAPLRLYLPDAASSPAADAAGGKNKKDGGADDSSSSGDVVEQDVLFVKFEFKAEVAVLGDVHAASAAVPVTDLVADGQTRRVSYQLVGPDGRQPNGVISFSYSFHPERNSDDVDGWSWSRSSDGEPATPPCCNTPPSTIAAAPRLYPGIEWTLTEQPAVYPPLTAKHLTIAAESLMCYPPASPPLPAEAASVVYPPVPEKSFRSVFPSTVVEPAVMASSLYPTVDLAPVSYYPPPATLYGVGFGNAAAPRNRCLYG